HPRRRYRRTDGRLLGDLPAGETRGLVGLRRYIDGQELREALDAGAHGFRRRRYRGGEGARRTRRRRLRKRLRRVARIEVLHVRRSVRQRLLPAAVQRRWLCRLAVGHVVVALIALLLCIAAGTVGGVFFAFSAFVMRALAQLPVSQAIAAMQRSNVVMLNPLFPDLFLRSALLAAVVVVVSLAGLSGPRSLLFMLAAALYLFGSFAVTFVCNVPRNNRLAGLAAVY